MNNLSIGLQLKKIAFKRPKGQGEYNYVSVASGQEAVGKSEIIALLQEDKEGWESIVQLKLKNESDESLLKKVKKGISNVLTESIYKQQFGDQQQENNCDKDETPPTKKQKVIIKPNTEVSNELVVKPNEEVSEKHHEEISDSKEDAEDVKTNVLSFVLAEVPKVEGTIKIEDEVEENETIDENELIKISELFSTTDDENKKILVFHVKKQIPHNDIRDKFTISDHWRDVISVQRTLTTAGKFRGVYLVTFSSEQSASDFVNMDLEVNGVFLDKIPLFDYKREKYFKNQVMKARSFQANH